MKKQRGFFILRIFILVANVAILIPDTGVLFYLELDANIEKYVTISIFILGVLALITQSIKIDSYLKKVFYTYSKKINFSRADNAIREAINLYGLSMNSKIVIMSSEDNTEFLSVKYMSEDAKSDPLQEMTLKKHEGCAGKAWAENRIYLFDRNKKLVGVDKRPIGYPGWNISKSNALLSENVQTLLSVPILNPSLEKDSVGDNSLIINFYSSRDSYDAYRSSEFQNNAEAFSTILASLFLIRDNVIDMQREVANLNNTMI